MTPRQTEILYRICWTIALLLLAVPFVFPFLWMISGGFKSTTEIFGAPTLIPESGVSRTSPKCSPTSPSRGSISIRFTSP